MSDEIVEVMPEMPETIIEKGRAMQRVQSEFTTAVAIQKPRERKKVIALCEEEAALAGDEFYYAWTVKSKTGPKLVEGLSIQAATSAARNWGNCAIPCRVDEHEDSYIFTATFVDFETGFNLQRTFRQRKTPNIGMKDTERAEDITFQIGQSKALRNVILSALPSWLTSKILAKAKENIIAKIEKMGIIKAIDKTLTFFQKHSVDVARIEEKIGKKTDKWNAEDLALLQGAMNALLNGQESAESLFPRKEVEMPKSKSNRETTQAEAGSQPDLAKKPCPITSPVNPDTGELSIEGL